MSDYFVPYEGNEPFVFVSYAHKDTDIVLPVIRGLHDRGVRVWYDGGVEVGNEWPDFIAEHLEKSFCVLAFVSQNFGDSHNCRREINFAIEERKEPIVIYLEPKELLKAGMRMQLGSLHALFMDRYPNTAAFLDTLVRAEIIGPCIGAPAEEIHSELQSQPIPFATIEFADEIQPLQTVSEEVPVEISYNKAEDPEALYAQAEKLRWEGKYKEAADLYLKAAQQGHADAQVRLGHCYEYGEGVPRNKKEAASWFRKAAEQGKAEGELQLGHCYAAGRGVPKNKEEAALWYRKAAQHGFSWGQFYMGECYRDGKGVPKDAAEAVKWYHKAAEQNHDIAQSRLGKCYELGAGVSVDYEKALYWYRKAQENGYPVTDAIIRCEKALK